MATEAQLGDGARQGRLREILIFSGFLLICAAGVFSVLLPETRDDSEKEDAPAGVTAAAGGTSTPAPAPTK